LPLLLWLLAARKKKLLLQHPHQLLLQRPLQHLHLLLTHPHQPLLHLLLTQPLLPLPLLLPAPRSNFFSDSKKPPHGGFFYGRLFSL
jgi:hypothetical protein